MAGPSGPAFLFNFYPRSPCGERRRVLTASCRAAGISIHALLAESDRMFTDKRHPEVLISIHALLAESDQFRHEMASAMYISIHALLAESDPLPVFSCWASNISIHALLAESDVLDTVSVQVRENFYPRSPCGERPFSVSFCAA